MKNKPQKIFSWLYASLRPIVKTSIRVFYKRLTIIGEENMPKGDTPVMLVANHQNGMMDPVLLCVIEKKQLHWLTRADIFKKPLVSKILHSINMLPVYRPKDKIPGSQEKNEAIFKEAHRRLAAGNILSVFPEGNHGNKKHLRPIKTGPARIAFGAEQEYNFDLNMEIIPIGIDYSNYVNFRSDVLVNYGKPIPVSQFKEEYLKDPIAAVKRFREVIRQALSDVMIDIQDLDLYDTIMAIEKTGEDLLLEHLKLPHGHLNEFKAFKHLTLQIEAKKEEEKEALEKLKPTAESYKNELNALNIEEKYLYTYGKSFIGGKLLLLLLSPLFLIGFIGIGGPYLLIKRYVEKHVKDPHFKSSIKVAMGAFGYLFFFILLFVIFSLIFSIKIATFLLIFVIIMGYFSLKYADEYRKIKAIQKINNLSESQFNSIMNKRNEIREIIKIFL